MARLVEEEADLKNALFEEMFIERDSDSSKDEIIPSQDGELQVPLVHTRRPNLVHTDNTRCLLIHRIKG